MVFRRAGRWPRSPARHASPRTPTTLPHPSPRLLLFSARAADAPGAPCAGRAAHTPTLGELRAHCERRVQQLHQRRYGEPPSRAARARQTPAAGEGVGGRRQRGRGEREWEGWDGDSMTSENTKRAKKRSSARLPAGLCFQTSSHTKSTRTSSRAMWAAHRHRSTAPPRGSVSGAHGRGQAALWPNVARVAHAKRRGRSPLGGCCGCDATSVVSPGSAAPLRRAVYRRPRLCWELLVGPLVMAQYHLQPAGSAGSDTAHALVMGARTRSKL